MNNKSLDKVLNSIDNSNFDIPKVNYSPSLENRQRQVTKKEFQNSHDSQFAAEAINKVEKNENHLPKNEIIKDKMIKVQMTKNITEYIPFDQNDNNVRVLGDGKIFNKKFSVKIIGVGGAGNNIIRYVATSRQWPDFVEITALNTDYNALKRMPEVQNKYVIGAEKLNGNGAGGDSNVAREVAEIDTEVIKKIITGTDILLLVAGLGKGTGTGAAPVIAKIAGEMNVLTIGLFNLPSIGAEGKKIYSNALEGLEKLQSVCDGFTAISNDRVIGVDRERTSIKRAYDDANEYFRIIITEFIDMITIGVDVNIDFSDIKNFFKNRNGFIFIKVTVTDYTKDSIKKSIEDAMQNGYIDIDIRESNSALYNFKINENVPSVILENARAALKEIVKTNDLNVVNGISFSDIYENAEINILLSGEYDLGKLISDGYGGLPQTKLISVESKTEVIEEPKKNTTKILDDENFSFLTKETSKLDDTNLKTNIIKTEEIIESSYLRSDSNVNSVGNKVNAWKRFKSLFSK